MRQHSRAVIISAATAAMLATPGNSGALPAAPSHPGDATSLPTSTGAGNQSRLVDLLAGSPKYLVYLRTELLAGRNDEVEDRPLVDAPATRLFARRPSGRTVDVGRAPRGLEPNPSLSRDMLVAESLTNPFSVDSRASWRWWNLATGHHGRLHHADGYFAGATPTGAVEIVGHKTYLVSTRGRRSRLKTPTAWNGVSSEISSDRGMVLFPNQGEPQFMAWAHPGTYTPLDIGLQTWGCHTMSAVALGCVGETPDFHYTAVSLVPLDGSAPTVEHDVLPASDDHLAVVGSTGWWSTTTGLASMTLGSTTVRRGPARYAASDRQREANETDPDPDVHLLSGTTMAADGHAIFAHDHGRTLELATSVNHAHTIVRAGMSRTSVASFALAPRRVVYVDNRHAGFTTVSAAIRQHGRSLTVGRPRTIARDTDDRLVGASHTVTVVSKPRRPLVDALVIRSDGHRHVVRSVSWDAYLEVSGTRVAYRSKAHKYAGKTLVYNAATGATSSVTTGRCCTATYGSLSNNRPALAGQHLSWIKDDGSVWTKNLKTGQTRRVAKPGGSDARGAVFAAGDYVAWSVKTPATHWRYGYRNVATMAAARTLHHPVLGVAPRGVLVSSRPPTIDDGKAGYAARFFLHTFTGKTVALLSRRTVTRAPQVAGSLLAWVDAAGKLKVRSLRS